MPRFHDDNEQSTGIAGACGGVPARSQPVRSASPARVRQAMLVLGVALLVLLGGCGGDDDTSRSADPTPTAEITTEPTPTVTTPTPTSTYSAAQIGAFETALRRYETYQKVAEPIWAAGKSTPVAARLIRDYYVPWQQIVNLLGRYEAGDIHLKGAPTVLYAKPTRIKLDEHGGGVVRFRACVDGSAVRVYQDGVQLPRGTNKPQWVTVELGGYADRGPDVRWLILTESNPKGKQPCPRAE